MEVAEQAASFSSAGSYWQVKPRRISPLAKYAHPALPAAQTELEQAAEEAAAEEHAAAYEVQHAAEVERSEAAASEAAEPAEVAEAAAGQIRCFMCRRGPGFCRHPGERGHLEAAKVDEAKAEAQSEAEMPTTAPATARGVANAAKRAPVTAQSGAPSAEALVTTSAARHLLKVKQALCHHALEQQGGAWGCILPAFHRGPHCIPARGKTRTATPALVVSRRGARGLLQ